MDLSTITDINMLKSLAFDTMIRIQTEQNNMQMLERRIIEVQEAEAAKKSKSEPKAKKDN